MARGWESKNVEAQQADREQSHETSAQVTPEEAARAARTKTLTLARARALSDLSAAKSPGHRAMLEAAIRALDDQLRETS